MRSDRPHTATVSGPRRGLALALGLALTATPALSHAQDPGAPTPASIMAPPVRPIQVDLRLGPERLLGAARLRITPKLSGLGPVIERPVYGPTLSLMLRPGPYTLELFTDRHTASRDLSVGPGLGPVTLEMTRPRVEAPSFESNSSLLNGLAVTAMVQVVGGAGVAIAGLARDGSVTRRNEALLMDALVDAASPTPKPTTGLALVESTYSTARYHRDLSRALTLEVTGTAVMMAGLAAALSAVPVGWGTRRRAAYVEMGIGAALAAGGATWLAFFERDRQQLRATTDPAERYTAKDLRPLRSAAAGGALLSGLGIGLVLFPAITLMSDAVTRRNRRTSFAPYMDRGQAGLLVQGRF